MPGFSEKVRYSLLQSFSFILRLTTKFGFIYWLVVNMVLGLFQPIVIDGAGHLLGRLAAVVAKQLLQGQKIVIVRCENMNISGNFFRSASYLLHGNVFKLQALPLRIFDSLELKSFFLRKDLLEVTRML